MENQPPKQSSRPKKQGSDYLAYFSLGLQLVIASALLGYLGHLADDALKIRFPVFLMIGIIAGLIASVIKILRQLDDKKK